MKIKIILTVVSLCLSVLTIVLAILYVTGKMANLELVIMCMLGCLVINAANCCLSLKNASGVKK